MHYITDSIPYLICGSIGFILLKSILHILSQKNEIKISSSHVIGSFLFTLYMTGLFSITISPIYGFTLPIGFKTNFIPFATISDMFSEIHTGQILSHAFINVIGNIMIFIPLGFLCPLLWEKFRKIHWGVLIGFVVSVIIESLQFFIAKGRSTDIDDIILNTIGGIVGYLFYIIFSKKSNRLKEMSIIHTEKKEKLLSLEAEMLIVLSIIVVNIYGFILHLTIVLA